MIKLVNKTLIVCFFLLTSSTLKSSSQTFFTEKKYQGDPLYDFISNWWKTPYRYGGNSKRGIDCSAFTQRFYKKTLGISLPRTAKEQYRHSQRVKRDSLCSGDLVFFRTKIKSGWHVGVYLTEGWFVQSSSHRGVTVGNLYDPWYKKHYYGAGRKI